MRKEQAATRRGFLAAAGGTMLAGCSGLAEFSEDTNTYISSHRLPDVTDDGDADPIIVEAIPVPIEQALLENRLRRVSSLLETVPVPLNSAKIPNGVIRQKLLHAADEATTYSQHARTTQTQFSALQSLRRAREQARYAAAGWAYVEDDRTTEELQAEYRQAVTDFRSFQSTLEYLGDGLVRAALVYAQVERNLNLVLDDRSPHISDASPLIAVAEWGEHAESARTLTDDTRYLHDQYTASLPSSAGDVEDSLATAAEELAATLQRRRANLPPEPTESNEDFAWRLRYRLRDDAESSVRPSRDAAGPARGVLAGLEGLTNFAAYERLRTRIENGETFRPADASDVRELRTQALTAVRTALKQSPRPELARPVLAEAAAAIAYGDEGLARFHGDVRAGRLTDPIRRYVTATVRARSVPAACQEVLATLNR